MKSIAAVLTSLLVQTALAQTEPGAAAARSFNFYTDVMGKRGLLVAIGILFFLYVYRNSVKLFAWVEDQTYGTRDYLLKKFEIMHIEVQPSRVTIALLALSFGLGILVFGIFALYSNFLAGSVLGAVLAFVGWKAPRPAVDYIEQRRVKAYQSQMVDGLNLLANGIRAGLSMPQAIGMIVDEMPPPISQEFNLVLQQTRIGVPLDEALENLNKRVPTPDNQMFVTSVNILRETGGNLAEVFDTIVTVIRERIRLQQKVDTYTAQGMFQGMVIFAMPYALILINGSSDPEYLSLLFTTPMGILMFVLILLTSGVGLWVIMKIVKIKV